MEKYEFNISVSLDFKTNRMIQILSILVLSPWICWSLTTSCILRFIYIFALWFISIFGSGNNHTFRKFRAAYISVFLQVIVSPSKTWNSRQF